jgi:hypothetical protein
MGLELEALDSSSTLSVGLSGRAQAATWGNHVFQRCHFGRRYDKGTVT